SNPEQLVVSKKLTLIESVARWGERGVDASVALPADSLALLLNFPLQKQDEFWFGLQNFYVITRYNRSRFYAMAVYQLSELIKAEYKLS
ncbi:MAG: lytic murein transglycosylase, partial [Pseudomonadales bacterium]